MKQPAYIYIFLGTFLLVSVTIVSAMDFDFKWIFYASLIGQAFVILMVYKVLKDVYSTKKTFEDFYEDHPIGKVEAIYEKLEKKENYR
jgi:membrane protein implicated in regulation of membrane protease activity